jgi:ECF transporter S component (folate family)
MKKRIELRFLVLAALFAALDIVCTRLLPPYFLPPGTFLIRVGLQFLVLALAGWTIGPGWAMGAAMAADIVGVLINPTGTGQFFPGYTLTAGMGGLMYGLVLYKRKPNIWRAGTAAALHMLIIALPLTSLWMMMQGFYPDYWSSFWLALPWRAGLVIPHTLMIFAMQKALEKPLVRF